MVSQKNQVVDIGTKFQLSQVRVMLELSKVLNGSETFGELQLSASDTDKRKQGDCYPKKKPRLSPKIIPLKPVLIVSSRFFHYLCV